MFFVFSGGNEKKGCVDIAPSWRSIKPSMTVFPARTTWGQPDAICLWWTHNSIYRPLDATVYVIKSTRSKPKKVSGHVITDVIIFRITSFTPWFGLTKKNHLSWHLILHCRKSAGLSEIATEILHQVVSFWQKKLTLWLCWKCWKS